jgi:hypothetical protein
MSRNATCFIYDILLWLEKAPQRLKALEFTVGCGGWI